MMAGARFQRRGPAPVRRELRSALQGIGYVFGQAHADIFGTGPEVTFANAPSLVPNGHGYARKLNGSNQYALATPPAGLIDLAGDFAILVAFIADATATSRIVHFSDTAANLNLQLLVSGSRLGLTLGASASTSSLAASNVALVPGAAYVAVAGRSSGAFFLTLNGVPQTGNSIGGIANNIVSSPINIGRRGDGASYFNGQISLFAYLRGQVDSIPLSVNPWQLFDGDEDDYSLPTAIDLVIPVTPAALLVSGGEVAMRVSRRVAVQAAQLQLAVADVAVRAARKIGVQPAALTVTSGQIDMRAARRVAVSAAGLILQAGEVQLRAVRRLVVAPTAATLTGGSIEFVHTPIEGETNYSLPVSPAVLVLTGGNVTMRVTRKIGAAPATLTLAAGDARLLAARRLAVGAAALQVGAGQAMLRATRRLPVNAAQLAITGGTVTLNYSSQVEYTRAPAGNGYSPQRVEVQSRPAQLGGSRPASIQRNRR